LFDLDGVLTKTDFQHRQAWKQTFDAFLQRHSGPTSSPFTTEDYLALVDGLPKPQAVRAFLNSRNIALPTGDPQDRTGTATVHGLANCKSELFDQNLQTHGAEPYPGTMRLVHAVREAGLKIAVVSASSHCEAVLDAAGISDDLFDTRIDASVTQRRSLHPKPAPDTYLAAASDLGVAPRAAAVIEDGPAGLRAARRGEFGHVIAVDRCGHPGILRRQHPDRLVHDLGELLPILSPS
jgi:HAD superfamily hydrolase (TIGR01509 family)